MKKLLFITTTILCLFSGLSKAQNASATWSAGGSAWYTGTNWVGSAYPGVQGAAASNSNIATFTSSATGTTFGINMNTNSLNLGALSLDNTRSTALNLGNSSGSATGVLRLYGASVNSVPNTIVRNNGSGTLTLQASQSGGGTMGIVLSNSTNNIVNLDGSGSIVISAIMSGSVGPLTFSGIGTNGRIDVTATNTFSQAANQLNFTGPEVRFSTDGSMGTAPAGVVANHIIIDGGRLSFLSGASITVNSNRGIQIGATAGTSISTPGASTITYNGIIADKPANTGAWTKQGGGILQLGGVCTYTGATAINNGTLQLTTGSNRLPTGTTLSIGQASSTNVGIFDMSGNSQQVAGINSTSGTNASAASNNTITSASVATLTIGGTGGTYSFGDGTDANSGIITGSLSIVKQGTNSQTFGDANTYTGTTAINAGSLFINGTTVAASTFSVAASGTLGGKGTIGGTVSNSGTVSPGSAASVSGTLTTGAFTFNSSSTYKFEITNVAGTAGGTSGWDELISTGAINVSTPTITIDLTTVGSTGFNSATDYLWTIASGASITGFSVSNFTISTTNFAPSFTGTFGIAQYGNTIAITYAAPIPSIAISTAHPSAGSIQQGTLNNIIGSIQLDITSAAASLSGITVTTGGTYVVGDIATSGFKFWINTANNLSGATQLGTSQAGAGNGSNVSVSGLSTALSNNTTYYILFTASLNGLATINNTIKITSTAFANITFALGNKTGTNPAPAGNDQTIAIAYPTQLVVTSISPTSIYAGVTSFSVTVQSQNANNFASNTQNNTDIILSNVGGGTFGGTLTGTITAGTNQVTISGLTLSSSASGITITATRTAGDVLTAGSTNINVIATPPTVAASGITFSNVLSTTLIINNWTDGNGANRIVVARLTATTRVAPTDATGYTANSLSFSDVLNPSTGTGNKVIYNGGSAPITVTGLSGTTNYSFDIYEQNGSGSLASYYYAATATGNTTTGVAGFYWNGGAIGANPANGGSGGWLTANGFRQPDATGAQATWSNGNPAIFAGSAGTVFIGSTAVTATSSTFNTSGYTLQCDASTTARTINSPIALANNVTLNLMDNSPGVTDRTLNIGGNISGGTGSAMNLLVNCVANKASRVNLSAANATLSVPVTVVAGTNNVSYGAAGFVATNTGCSLTSAATITNNTNYNTMIGATSGNDITVNSVISGNSVLQISAGSNGGAGLIVLNAANTNTGGTMLNNTISGVVKLGVDNAISNGLLLFSDGATSVGAIDMNGHNLTVSSISIPTGGLANGITNQVGATLSTLTIEGSANTTFSSIIGIPGNVVNLPSASNNIALTLSSANNGTLTLSGANTFIGGTNILGGTLKSGANEVLANSGAVTIDGGTWNMNGKTENIGALTLTNGTISSATATLTPNSIVAENGTIAAIIVGGTSVVKNNSGTLSMTNNANSYTGGTTINGGTILQDDANEIGDVTGDLTINNGTYKLTTTSISSARNVILGSNFSIVNITGSGITYTATTGGNFTGSGHLNKEGDGTLELQSHCLYTGSTSINGGTLRLNRSGGTTIPVTNDIFINSTATLRVSENQTLNNLVLESGATLVVDNGVTLTINGNFIHNGGTITLNGTGTILYGAGAVLTYSASVGQTTGAEVTNPNNITISNSNGVTLSSDITITGTLTFTTGVLNTGAFVFFVNNNSVNAVTGYSATAYVNGNLKRKVGASGSYDFPVGTASNYELANLVLNAQVGINDITASFNATISGTQPDGNTCLINGTGIYNMLNGGIWTLTPDVEPTGGTIDITLKEKGQTNSAASPEQYGIISRDNSASAWGFSGTHNNNTQSETGGVATAVVTGITHLSDWGFGEGGHALPVVLTSFNANAVSSTNVSITWTTSSEINTKNFVVEHSNDGIHYTEIATVEAAGTSTVELNYFANDNNPVAGINYYRLHQFDVDGKSTYSNVRSVNIGGNNATDVVVYPNPVTSGNVVIAFNNASINTIKVYKVTGMKVAELSNVSSSAKINTDAFDNGVYFITITNQTTGEVSRTQFLKSK